MAKVIYEINEEGWWSQVKEWISWNGSPFEWMAYFFTACLLVIESSVFWATTDLAPWIFLFGFIALLGLTVSILAVRCE